MYSHKTQTTSTISSLRRVGEKKVEEKRMKQVKQSVSCEQESEVYTEKGVT